MIRILTIVALSLGLSACQQSSSRSSEASAGATVSQAAVSTGNVNDTRQAKQLFGAAKRPSATGSQAVGGYAKGCQGGAVQLPETGPTWQAMRLSRNRYWSQPATVDFVKDLSRFAAQQPGWAGLYIGDMSQPRGGPMLTGHRSHQSGLDVDIWMLPPKSLTLSAAERENISSISMRRSKGAYTNSSWSPQHEAILKRAASDPRVARIFVFPGAKVAMCKNARGDRSWLRKIRPWWGHHYHFHVRLDCPRGDNNCVPQSPPPAGDGCADAEQWVRNILNPPPPDPNAPAPKPRRELTMRDLPGQCGPILNANAR